MCGFGNLSQRALESFGKVLEILTGDPVRTLSNLFVLLGPGNTSQLKNPIN
jgi:hypothetical protein